MQSIQGSNPTDALMTRRSEIFFCWRIEFCHNTNTTQNRTVYNKTSNLRARFVPNNKINAATTYKYSWTFSLGWRREEGGGGRGQMWRLPYCTVFSKVVSAFHPETIPTSTVTMLLVWHLCIYNKQYIFKIGYLPHSVVLENRFWELPIHYIQVLKCKI